MVPAISKPRQIPGGHLCTYDVHITSLLYINYHSHFLYVRYAWYMHIHIIVTSATINHKTMIHMEANRWFSLPFVRLPSISLNWSCVTTHNYFWQCALCTHLLIHITTSILEPKILKRVWYLLFTYVHNVYLLTTYLANQTAAVSSTKGVWQ